MQPRDWCEPPTAFGKVRGPRPRWLPPKSDDESLPAFRAAVVQHAIAVSVRSFKNTRSPRVTQEMLARLDGRTDAMNRWNARLNGRLPMTFKDVAQLVALLPGCLPDQQEMNLLLQEAEETGANRGTPDGQ